MLVLFIHVLFKRRQLAMQLHITYIVFLQLKLRILRIMYHSRSVFRQLGVFNQDLEGFDLLWLKAIRGVDRMLATGNIS